MRAKVALLPPPPPKPQTKNPPKTQAKFTPKGEKRAAPPPPPPQSNDQNTRDMVNDGRERERQGDLTSDMMTLLSAESDLLIALASFKRVLVNTTENRRI